MLPIRECRHLPVSFRVDGEWIVAKKDWQEAKKKQKARGMSMEGASLDSGNTHQELSPGYQPEMDEMRCILYAHGGAFAELAHASYRLLFTTGGYYFGSIDQERCVTQMTRGPATNDLSPDILYND